MNGYRKLLYAALTVAVVLLLAVGGLLATVYSATGRFPTEGARYPRHRIDELVWPTIGYPAMVVPGRVLKLEVDLRGGSAAGHQPGRVAGWSATIRPSRKELKGLTYQLKAAGARRGASRRWPRGSRRGRSREVWHVAVKVPADAVPELYDMTVSAEVSGRAHSDRQPHSVSVVEDDDDTFTFITLADIHVHKRGISGIFQSQTDKGITPGGRPLFFERAIEQVNLIRPDFVVMLGDNVRAQHRPGDYQYEFNRFFPELSRFEVPVFMVPGNHDQYVNEVDGARVWEENIGPLYYSFDAGGCHFTAVNAYEWPFDDRIVMKKLGLFVYPRKWQGQVLGEEEGKEYPAKGGQLRWIRDDLVAHQDSRLRFMVLHHDPFTPNGEGAGYDNETFAGVVSLGGGGRGREALKELSARYRVDMVMGGHLHTDAVGRAPWSDGKGQTTYACQTCVYFDEGGDREDYPGYRLVKVVDGKVEGFGYVAEVHSFPFYDGSRLHGKTDIDSLELPALSAVGTQGQGGERWTGWELVSYLGVPVTVRGLVKVVDGRPGDGAAENGRVYRAVPVPGKGERTLVYAEASAPAGASAHGTRKHGLPSKTLVKVPYFPPP